MTEPVDKNSLICLNLKKERVLLFNFFDEKECGIIFTSKDVAGTQELLDSEEIEYLIVEVSKSLFSNPNTLIQLTKNYPAIKIILVVCSQMNLSESQYIEFSKVSELMLFAPLSANEISIKLNALLANKKAVSKTNAEQRETISAINNKDEKADECQTLWDVFFEDSIQAKLIVDASTQKIEKVNSSLLELLGRKKAHLLGKKWNILDAKINHKKYNNYIKEISSNDKTEFTINYTFQKNTFNLIAKYQMGVLNEEIVYIGDLAVEKSEGISSKLYDLLSMVTQLEITDSDFSFVLDEILKALKLNFLAFFEYSNNKLLKPVIVGDGQLVKNFLKKSLAELLDVIHGKQVLEIDRDNHRMNEYSGVLEKNGLHSFCVHPIAHHNKTYGVIVSGGYNRVDSWPVQSVLLSSLANQCKFGLFQKSIVEQRTMDGLTDKLTGLPNRTSMTNKFAKIMEVGVDSGKYLSLMIIDFDKINFLNKSMGIELTNQIIVNISQIITKCIRSKGDVYRLSGDEFMVLLKPHLNKKLVELLAKDLIKRLQVPILLSTGEDTKIDFNIGISIFPDDGQTVSSMMKNADLAMYDAKLAGRNNFVVFKYSETGQALKQKTEMEENLKKAITEEHIKVFFQPKINAVTEDIIGFESLVRWIDPEIGMINPGHFIPLAEETGLINDIGEYVTKRSCEMLVKWQKHYGLPLTCSINLSAVQLMDSNLPSKLEKIVNLSGVHPHYIDFEITETISLDVVPKLVESLNEIVAIGCTLSIDDFGTGHSSLDYVKKIPASFIKIDQSFVCNIGLNPEDEAILDATINIAKRLNRKIVAEGVETEAQREYLLERECEYFQGFLFSRPLPEEQIEQLLKERVELMGSV